MADADLRELERRWRSSDGSDEDGIACLRAWRRAGTLSEERLNLAATLGHPSAIALLEREPREVWHGDWFRELAAYGTEIGLHAACALLAEHREGLQAHARVALDSFLRSLKEWKEGEPTEGLRALVARLRPTTQPPNAGAFNPTGTSDDDDVHAAMKAWGGPNVDIWELWAVDKMREVCEGLVDPLQRGKSLRGALADCASLSYYGARDRDRFAVQAALLTYLDLPFDRETLRDPTVGPKRPEPSPPSPPVSPSPRVEGAREGQERRSYSPNYGLPPEDSKAGSACGSGVALVLGALLLGAFLVPELQKRLAPPPPPPVAKRPAKPPSNERALDLSRVALTDDRAWGLLTETDRTGGLTLRSTKTESPLNVVVSPGVVFEMGGRRYATRMPMTARLHAGYPSQGLSTVSLEPDPWRLAVHPEAPVTSRPPREGQEQVVASVLQKLDRLSVRFRVVQAVVTVLVHDPVDPFLGAEELFARQRARTSRSFRYDWPSRGEDLGHVRKLLAMTGHDPSSFRAFRR